MSWNASCFRPCLRYPEHNYSTRFLWISFLSSLTNAHSWFSKQNYVPHNDIIYSQRKKLSTVSTACLDFLAEDNVTSHVKFWKPGVAQVILIIFFERNFVFQRYPLGSGIVFFHKPHEMGIFVAIWVTLGRSTCDMEPNVRCFSCCCARE